MPARRRSARKRQASKKLNTEAEDSIPMRGAKRSKPSDETTIKSSKKVKGSHDKYCWICHQPCLEKKCQHCLRVYHSACLKKSTQFDVVCYKCQQTEKEKKIFANKVTKAQLSDMLQFAIERVFSKTDKDIVPLFVLQSADNYKLCCIIDYLYITDRAKETESVGYNSASELLDDVEWMYHNCAIIYGVDSRVFKAAKEVLKLFKQEYEDMLNCCLCYLRILNKSDDEKEEYVFYKPCEMLHPVIWAKISGFSHWPAKCYRVINGTAHVKFFHTLQMGSAKINNCCFLTVEYPWSNKRKKDNGLILAMEQLDMYLYFFNLKYGTYPFQPKKIRYNHNKAEDIMKEIKEKAFPCPIIEEPREDFNTSVLPNTSQKHLVQNTSPIIYQQEMAINGHLLPGVHKEKQNFVGCDDQLLQVPFISEADSSISISNVISGPINVNSHDLNSVDFCVEDSSVVISEPALQAEMTETFEASSTLPENCSQASADSSDEPNVISSEFSDDSEVQIIEAYTSNVEVTHADRPRTTLSRRYLSPVADDLIETILKKDPSACVLLKESSELAHNLFMHFWGLSNKNPGTPRMALTEKSAIFAMCEKINELQQSRHANRKQKDDSSNITERVMKHMIRMKEMSDRKNMELQERVTNLESENLKMIDIVAENARLKIENEKIKHTNRNQNEKEVTTVKTFVIEETTETVRVELAQTNNQAHNANIAQVHTSTMQTEQQVQSRKTLGMFSRK